MILTWKPKALRKSKQQSCGIFSFRESKGTTSPPHHHNHQYHYFLHCYLTSSLQGGPLWQDFKMSWYRHEVKTPNLHNWYIVILQRKRRPASDFLPAMLFPIWIIHRFSWAGTQCSLNDNLNENDHLTWQKIISKWIQVIF